MVRFSRNLNRTLLTRLSQDCHKIVVCKLLKMETNSILHCKFWWWVSLWELLEPISVVKDQVRNSQISHDTDKYVPPGLLEIDNLLLILYSYTRLYDTHTNILTNTAGFKGFRYHQSIWRNMQAFPPLKLIPILPTRCLCSISNWWWHNWQNINVMCSIHSISIVIGRLTPGTNQQPAIYLTNREEGGYFRARLNQHLVGWLVNFHVTGVSGGGWTRLIPRYVCIAVLWWLRSRLEHVLF